jgi:hypothetical protein
MKIAFDTNMLLSGMAHCRQVVKKLIDTYPQVLKIALDNSGHLENEYEAYLSQHSDLLGESDLAIVYSLICSERDAFVTEVDCTLPQPDLDYFRQQLQCGHEVEPALFGIAKNNPNDTFVLLAARLSGAIGRCYTKHYMELERRYIPNHDKLHSSLASTLADRPCPTDYQSLLVLIEACKNRGKSTEDERCEFKREISRTVLKSLPTKVCSMLRKEGGYILIGVADDGKVTGFEAPNGPGKAIEQISSNVIDSITPNAAEFISINQVRNIPIEIIPEEDKVVVAIHIQKGTTAFRCNGERPIRVGTNTTYER